MEPRALLHAYLKDLVQSYGLPVAYGPLLLALLEKRTVDNQLMLDAAVKRSIGTEWGYQVGSLDNILGKLTACGLLERQSRGVYRFPPQLFWEAGSESDITHLEWTRIYQEESRKEKLIVRLQANQNQEEQ